MAGNELKCQEACHVDQGRRYVIAIHGSPTQFWRSQHLLGYDIRTVAPIATHVSYRNAPVLASSAMPLAMRRYRRPGRKESDDLRSCNKP